MPDRFIDIANRYAEETADDNDKACLYVRQACRRHLDDLAKSKKKSARFEFSDEAIQKICNFAHRMPHTKGVWASRGETIKLEPWQVFTYGSVFGWLRTDGLRRFRYAFCEIPRKNAKSTMLAIAGLYMATEDGEHGADVLCSATTEEQAYYVFRPAWEMVAKMPALQEWYGAKLGGTHQNPGPIFIPETGSSFKPIIGIPKDGASPHFAIVDEYHEHKSDGVYQTLVTGAKARSQPLVWVITTAGSDTSGPCYSLRGDVINLLGGRTEDDETFGIIYTIDEEDDWATEAALRKANPNFGVSVNAENLLGDMRRAVNSARLQNDFKTKHLNIWVGAKSSWMNMDKWGKCARTMKEEEFLREDCWIGVDLSVRDDFTSVAKLFVRDGEYYLFTRHYYPEAKINEPERQTYQEWAHNEKLISIPGEVIDYDVVLEDILEDAERFHVMAVGYDKYFAHQFAIDMTQRGLNAIEVPQIASKFTEPMRLMEDEVNALRFHHDGNPVMTWHVGNTVLKTSSRHGFLPDKERRENKIDGVSATLTALVLAMSHQPESNFIPTGRLVNF